MNGLTEQTIDRFQTDVERLEQALGRVIVGQRVLIRELIYAVLAGGHVLLEGLPGLGKTHLAKALAVALDRPLARIQCTPDLMPADITGSEILVRGETDGSQRLDFRPGPIFASLVLMDEVNRAPPRTQAALLEAMQEGQVTTAGTRYPLPHPFWVLATQNPIELEGTFPLPEAQLDRFLFKLTVPYPDEDALLAMLEVSLDHDEVQRVGVILDNRRLAEMLEQVTEVFIATPVKQAAVRLILATHPDQGHALARRHFRYGASPRGLQSLLRAARVRALCYGRGHVALEDLRAVALPALRHRVLLTIVSEVEGEDTGDILERILVGLEGFA